MCVGLFVVSYDPLISIESVVISISFLMLVICVLSLVFNSLARDLSILCYNFKEPTFCFIDFSLSFYFVLFLISVISALNFLISFPLFSLALFCFLFLES